MISSGRTLNRALCLGLFSHLCAASFPFLAKVSLEGLGAYRGAFVIYVVAVTIGWALSIGSRSLSSSKVALIVSALGNGKMLMTFCALMTLATISVLLFYVGLRQSNPGEFSFVVRLEHLFAMLLGFVALGERARIWNVLGALVGFSGWILVVNFGSVQGAALWYAIGYIITSGSSTMLAQLMLRNMDDRAFFLLRMTATMLTLAMMTISLEEKALSSVSNGAGTLVLTIVSGAVLTALFLNRYYAMSRLPLWWYSTLSATQMIFTPLFSWMTGKALTWQVILGGAVVTVGVTLASIPFRPKEPQTVSAF